MTRAVAGQVFALFVIAVAAAEVGVGLAIVLLIYRNRRSIDLDERRPAEGLSRMWFFTHVWIIPALMALSFLLILFFGKQHAREGCRDRHRVRRRRVRAGAGHRRQLDHRRDDAPEGDRVLGARARSTRRAARSPPKRSRRARPTAAPTEADGHAPRSEAALRGGRAPAAAAEGESAAPAPAAARQRAAGAEEEEHVHPARSSGAPRGSTPATSRLSSRHPRRRPVGADARRRHAHLAAGARLLHRLRRTATVATPTTSPSCRCSPPRCCSSS